MRKVLVLPIALAVLILATPMADADNCANGNEIMATSVSLTAINAVPAMNAVAIADTAFRAATATENVADVIVAKKAPTVGHAIRYTNTLTAQATITQGGLTAISATENVHLRA